jgi:hypothetical protein
MGETKRAIARDAQEQEARIKDRFTSTLVSAASIIAAVRLAREERIGRPSPKVFSALADAVALARIVLDKIIR